MLRSLCRTGLRSRRFAVRNRRCQSTTSTGPKPVSPWSGGGVLGIAAATGAIKEIISELGNDEIISTDDEDLKTHGYSEWSTVNPDTLPVAVAYPRSTAEVAAIARICHKHRVPLIPFSGGTSLEGNFSAPYGGVSVDFAFMDRILQFNKDDMDVVVQPSVGWQDLNQALADMGAGLFFPVDPGPTARIGGMVGTNCSGTNAVRYGTMKDWVINLTVVLADGRIIKTRRRPRSEGTLGIVTEATLKLAVIPEVYSVGVVSFPTIRDAAAAAAGVMQAGVPVSCMEIMDDVQMHVVNLGGNTAPRVWKEKPTLFFKFSGSKASVAENISTVEAITSRNNGEEFEFAKNEQEQKLLWSARKESLWSMLALRKEGEDVSVPLSRLADLIEVSKKEMDDLGMFASILGHIGDGNFHESIMYNKKDPKERAKVEKCVKNMVNRALNMEDQLAGKWSNAGPQEDRSRSASRNPPEKNNKQATSGQEKRSITLRLSNLPKDITVPQLWRAFSPKGNIQQVELYDSRPHEKWAVGSIVFAPPPKIEFWRETRLEMNFHGHEEPVTIYVGVTEVRHESRQSREEQRCSSIISMPLNSLDFGSLANRDTMVIGETIKSLEKDDILLELNTRKGEITIYFQFQEKQRHITRKRQYKIVTQASAIKKV
ncbi:hypothetical protein PWT90_03911 [Aphanocladium album]|nr:hypothetical protein PWT90_03911 [Aphanocladium album]